MIDQVSRLTELFPRQNLTLGVGEVTFRNFLLATRHASTHTTANPVLTYKKTMLISTPILSSIMKRSQSTDDIVVNSTERSHVQYVQGSPSRETKTAAAGDINKSVSLSMYVAFIKFA
jgi:hypothetical protein